MLNAWVELDPPLESQSLASERSLSLNFTRDMLAPGNNKGSVMAITLVVLEEQK